MTVNELVVIFPPGTTFFIHMIYADAVKTRALWEKNHSVGWGSDFYGITRHPVGECTVRDIQIPVLTGYKSNCDVTVFAFEKDFCKKLEELERAKDGSRTDQGADDHIRLPGAAGTGAGEGKEKAMAL